MTIEPYPYLGARMLWSLLGIESDRQQQYVACSWTQFAGVPQKLVRIEDAFLIKYIVMKVGELPELELLCLCLQVQEGEEDEHGDSLFYQGKWHFDLFL